MTYTAWMIPGMYPKIVKRMLMNNEDEQPLSKNTPKGGKIIANINLKMSEHVTAMIVYSSKTIEFPCFIYCVAQRATGANIF